jgi:hypothetical protein
MIWITRTTWELTDLCAECFDFFRSRILRLTMKFEWARPLFYNRAMRLAFLFALSCASSLPLALFFPLWLLLFGPLVYGVPHIASSLRYFHHSAKAGSQESQDDTRTRSFAFLAAGVILVAVFVHRLILTQNFFSISMPQLSEWKGSTYIDLIALGITFVLGAWIYRKSFSQLIAGALFIAPLATAFWFKPMETIGVMVLVHNFIAFVYWIRATQTRSERGVAWGALGITLGVSVAIFLGAFDPLYSYFHHFEPRLALNVAQLTAQDTGRLIAPWWQGADSFWLHACSVYGFGQALHYFVWLKAIPDQFHTHDVPTTFRQSLKLLSEDFGRAVALALVFISVASVVIWSFMTLQEARMIYFCLAGYHGYLEIAGLALSVYPGSSKRKNAPAGSSAGADKLIQLSKARRLFSLSPQRPDNS